VAKYRLVYIAADIIDHRHGFAIVWKEVKASHQAKAAKAAHQVQD
jgi:hypothetical protein